MSPKITLCLVAIYWISIPAHAVQGGHPVPTTAAGFAADSELYRVDDESILLSAARAIIADDPDCALVTIDRNGQPRVRTVTASSPEDDMTIWIATRPGTRKVHQIQQNEKVALYFNDDAKLSYVSVMGRATLHDDSATKEAKTFYDKARLETFFPDYPDNYVLIKVEPIWIEVLGHGVLDHPETWRPQAVVLEGELLQSLSGRSH